MNTFAKSISRVFRGALDAFRNYPAALGSALAFSIVTLIRIALDWPEQEAWNFLFNCLHWALVVSALFSLAATAYVKSRRNTKSAFAAANLSGAAVAGIAFMALYFFGAAEESYTDYTVLSALASARAAAFSFACLVAFVLASASPRDGSGFTRSLFMAHKAFVIALLYALVIELGTTGVAGAIQSLLYQDMSEKVYMVLGTLSGFLGFSIFVGYFPDFSRGEDDERRAEVEKQPRFIEILFDSILVPVVLALTVVLLIWAIKTAVGGMQVSFVRLYSVAASYTVGGLWLMAMVDGHKGVLPTLYRRAYPIASLVILAFEAWAVVKNLAATGMKDAEYIFLLLWILAAAGAILLLLVKSKAHAILAVIAACLAVFSVLPAVGYHALPASWQTQRLENVLTREGMLENGQVTPAAAEPSQEARETVTDAVQFLANARDARLPEWFDREWNQDETFKTAFGFEKVWPKVEPAVPGYVRPGTYMYLSPEAFDISGYQWAVNPQYMEKEPETASSVTGSRGTYQVSWTTADNGMPTVKVTLNDAVILEEDLTDYMEAFQAKYPAGEQAHEAGFQDMSVVLESPQMTVLAVFNSVEFTMDPDNDTPEYWLSLNSLYLKENP